MSPVIAAEIDLFFTVIAAIMFIIGMLKLFEAYLWWLEMRSRHGKRRWRKK